MSFIDPNSPFAFFFNKDSMKSSELYKIAERDAKVQEEMATQYGSRVPDWDEESAAELKQKEKEDKDWEDYKETAGNRLQSKPSDVDSLAAEYSIEAAGGLRDAPSSDIYGTDFGFQRHIATSTVVTGNQELDLSTTRYFKQRPRYLELPVTRFRDDILDRIDSNQVSIFSGSTGSGKTTQVPQYILDDCVSKKKPVNILVTQPRKIAARSSAKRVCDERGWDLGGLVGYQVGLDKMNKGPDTRLLYVTTGILLNELAGEGRIKRYTHIIIDEIHERDLEIDLCLAILKKKLFTTDTNLKLILMSATMEEKKFQEYFARSEPGLSRPVPAQHLDIGARDSGLEGPPHVVSVFPWSHKNQITEDMFDLAAPQLHEECVQECVKIICTMEQWERKEQLKQPGAVLVFLPGIREINTVRQQLEAAASPVSPLRILPIHSTIPWEELKCIFDECRPGFRKVILATNIAESSLTIPDVKHVIDFCLTKHIEADPYTKYPRLVLQWASKQQLIQRKGRVGRVSSGRVYRLIPEELEAKLPEEHLPEMARVPLSTLILRIKRCNQGTPKEILALTMDPPKIQDILAAVLELKEIGALLLTTDGKESSTDGDLTCLGDIISKMPLDPKLGKLIVLGHIFGVAEETVIIAAGLNGKSIFSAPFGREVVAFHKKMRWANGTFSDCLAVLNAYQNWNRLKARGKFSMQVGSNLEEEFCRQQGLERKQLHEMAELVSEVRRSLELAGVVPLPNQPRPQQPYLLLRLAIFGAFYPNYYVQVFNPELEKNAHRVLDGGDPKVSVYLQGFPRDQADMGVIYAQQIYSMLRLCTGDVEAMPIIKFDGANIIVQFPTDSSRSMRTDILPAVYAAVKMRQCQSRREPLQLRVFERREDAEMALAKLQAAHRPGNDSNAALRVPPLSPLSMKTSRLQLDMRHWGSPQQLWLMAADRREEEARLNSLLAEASRSPHRPQGVQQGQVYLAPFKGGSHDDIILYRGLVEKVRGAQSTVFFLDYGNRQIVMVEDLRQAPPSLQLELSTIPSLAMECSMAGIQPNQARNENGQWDDECLTELGRLLREAEESGRALEATVYSVVQTEREPNRFLVNLASLSLYNTEGVKIELKQWLLDQGYGQAHLESVLSQTDAQNRLDFSTSSEEMKQELDRENRFHSAAMPMNTDNSLDAAVGRRRRADLKGPFSPLEQGVSALFKDRKPHQAKIDRLSVNSVLLARSSGDRHDSWMVAASICHSSASTGVQLRETTMMPSVPGFGALAAIIFAPRVELVRSTDETRYIAAHIGLGPKESLAKLKKSGGSSGYEAFNDVFDSCINLDFRLREEDIKMMEALRYHLSKMLSTTSDKVLRLTQKESLLRSQQDIQDTAWKLFSTARPFWDKEFVAADAERLWRFPGLARREDTMLPVPAVRIYPGILFNRLRSSLKEEAKLRDLALNRDPKECLKPSVRCPVCPSRAILYSTIRALADHLLSEDHKTSLRFYK